MQPEATERLSKPRGQLSSKSVYLCHADCMQTLSGTAELQVTSEYALTTASRKRERQPSVRSRQVIRLRRLSMRRERSSRDSMCLPVTRTRERSPRSQLYRCQNQLCNPQYVQYLRNSTTKVSRGRRRGACSRVGVLCQANGVVGGGGCFVLLILFLDTLRVGTRCSFSGILCNTTCCRRCVPCRQLSRSVQLVGETNLAMIHIKRST